MGFPAAISELEQKRAERDAGANPAGARREKRAAVANSRAVDAYTVKQVCFDYICGYLASNCKDKGVIEG